MFPIIDYNRVFARMPEIMRLDLTFKNNAWEGRYYINGEPHPNKHDKLRVKLYNGIWVHEQGGESMSLVKWLVTYGGCDTYKDAFSLMRGNDVKLNNFHYDSKEKEIRYVSKNDMGALMAFSFDRCPLYVWMSSLFGEGNVRATWSRYNVCTDSYSRAVFWYIDRNGHILHDKRISYLYNGHRNRKYGASRRYKVGDGYIGRCLFGEHLIADADVINVVESEKSALLASSMWGTRKGLWIATGGKSNIGLISDIKDKNVRLFPDMDAADEWAKHGDIVEWWKGFELDEHSDIGDLVVKLKTK